MRLFPTPGCRWQADPGYRLVGPRRAAGIPVSVVPGPSAPVTALCRERHCAAAVRVLGFLPAAARIRKDAGALANLALTLIFLNVRTD
ncbi:MAG: hypothetical protein ACLR0N_08345 [Bilophila wadsworthia]